jgi:hypothetical protein
MGLVTFPKTSPLRFASVGVTPPRGGGVAYARFKQLPKTTRGCFDFALRATLNMTTEGMGLVIVRKEKIPYVSF